MFVNLVWENREKKKKERIGKEKNLTKRSYLCSLFLIFVVAKLKFVVQHGLKVV